jgi:hypothetical protein
VHSPLTPLPRRLFRAVVIRSYHVLTTTLKVCGTQSAWFFVIVVGHHFGGSNSPGTGSVLKTTLPGTTCIAGPPI